MKHVMIGNGTQKVVRETEKALLLSNADNPSGPSAWFPRSALRKMRDVRWANGEIVTRYDLESWFYSKGTPEHDLVLGRAV